MNIQDDEVSLRDYLETILKYKFFIVIFTILFTISFAGYRSLTSSTEYVTESLIRLTFPGIEKHLNPDGSLFEKEQIITPYILEKVANSIQKEDTGKAPLNLRDLTSIQPHIPASIEKAMKKTGRKKNIMALLNKESKKGFSFFPNQFLLSLTMGKDDFLGREKSEEILGSIIREYNKEFKLKFVEHPEIVKAVPKDFLRDYIVGDVVTLLRNRIHILKKNLAAREKQGVSFTSPDSGLTFGFIKNKLAKIGKELTLFATRTRQTPFDIPEIPENIVEQYHYENIVSTLKSRAKALGAFIDTKIKQGGTFSADNSERTFMDIRTELEYIETGGLNNFGIYPMVFNRIPENIVDNYDYSEVISILKSRVEVIRKFLANRINQSAFFRGKSGLTFTALINDLDLLESIKIKDIESAISTSLLTKNKPAVIRKHEFWIKESEILQKKKKAEAQIAEELLAKYGGGGAFSSFQHQPVSEPGSTPESAEASGNAKTPQTAPTPSPVTSALNTGGVAVDLKQLMEGIAPDQERGLLLRRALEASIESRNALIEREAREVEITLLRKKMESKERGEKSEDEFIEFIEKSLAFLVSNVNDLNGKANRLNLEYLAGKTLHDKMGKELRNDEEIFLSVNESLNTIVGKLNRLIAKTRKYDREFMEYNLETLTRELNLWIQKTNKLNKDFLSYRYGIPLRIDSYPKTFILSPVSNKQLIIVILSGLMLSIFTAFFRDYWKKSGEEKLRTQTGEYPSNQVQSIPREKIAKG